VSYDGYFDSITIPVPNDGKNGIPQQQGGMAVFEGILVYPKPMN
jgi:hypothetical protein